MSIPVRVKNNSSMSAEQGNLLRQSALLIQWNDSERTTTARVPVHGEIFRIGLFEEKDVSSLRHSQGSGPKEKDRKGSWRYERAHRGP